MPDGSVPLLIALIALIAMSGFFSASETAFSCSNKIKLRSLETNGSKRAGKVLNLAEQKFDRLISSILIGNNIVNLTAATISTILFSKLITNGADSSVISTVVITVAVLIFGEITPKFIAKVNPEKTAMLFYPVSMFFFYLFYPLLILFGGWKILISKVFRLKNEEVVTEDEIMTVVEEAEEDGTIKKEETKLIRSVIEFDDVEVGDILVPRVNMVAIEVSTPIEKIKEIFEKEGYSRLPVYKDNIDIIIGTIHEKDFFNVYLSGKNNIDSILQNACYTTEHIKISKLLKILQKKKVHMAVVLDEYGGTLGLVTMEDIIEELVGEIWDEHDEEVNYFKRLNDNTFTIDANAPLSDFFEKFDLTEEEDQFETLTVSGFVIAHLGEIPHAGKKFDFKHLSIEVLKSTVKRVLEIKVVVNEKTED